MRDIGYMDANLKQMYHLHMWLTIQKFLFFYLDYTKVLILKDISSNINYCNYNWGISKLKEPYLDVTPIQIFTLYKNTKLVRKSLALK